MSQSISYTGGDRKRLIRFYLLSWLLPGLLTAAVVLVAMDRAQPAVRAMGGVAAMFGPWASVVVKLPIVDFPNAGEFIFPWLILACTAAVAGVVGGSLLIAHKVFRIVCRAVFLVMVPLWLYCGWALIGCLYT